MAYELTPLKKKLPEKPVQDPRTPFTEEIPESDPRDLAFRMHQQEMLTKPQDQIISEGLSGVEDTGQGLLNAASPIQTGSATSNLAAKALGQRAQRHFETSLNSLMQKQKLQAPLQQFENTRQLSDENQKDLEMEQKRQAVQHAISANNYNLSLQDKALVFDQWMSEQQMYLLQKHRELSDYVYNENKRKAAIAARNQIISTILGVGGTVAGGIIGGAPGAMIGGTAAKTGADAVLPGAGNPQALPGVPAGPSNLQSSESQYPGLQYPDMRNTATFKPPMSG